MGFTGKEADEEVGLVYFGQRYLMPRIARWSTPDPLQIHALGGGEPFNSYHYVSGNLLQATDPVGLGDPDAGVPQVRDAGLPGGAADTDSYGYATSRSFDEASAPPNAVPPEVSAAIQMWYNATRPPQSNQELAHSQQKADRIALGAAIGAADQVTLGHFTEALRQVDRAHFRAVWSDPDVALGYLSGVLGTTLAEAWGAAELVVGGGAIAATPDGPPQLLGGAMVVAGVGVGAHAAAGVMANAHNISHAASTVVLAENWGGEGDAPTHQTRGSTAARGAGRSLDDLSASGRLIDPADSAGQLTRAGRALQKHGNRPATAFPRARGNPPRINQSGQDVLDDILTSPGSTTRSGNRFGGDDIIAPDGRGARFDADGVFRGFLEP